MPPLRGWFIDFGDPLSRAGEGTRPYVVRSLSIGAFRRQGIRAGWLVADSSHFREQLGHAHSRKRFEERRNLRRHFGEVAGDLVHPRRVAVAGGNDGDFVHVGKRAGHGSDDLGHAGEQLVDDRRLVVLLVGFGFHVHGFGFGFTLLEDDFRFGFALSANRRRVTFGFGNQALLFGGGEGFDPLT